jgi:hypothetical protein
VDYAAIALPLHEWAIPISAAGVFPKSYNYRKQISSHYRNNGGYRCLYNGIVQMQIEPLQSRLR